MNIAELEQCYNTLATRYKLPSLAPATLTMESTTVTRLEELLLAIETFAPLQGWICYQSKVHSFWHGEPWRLADVGLPLSGEFIDDNGNALHLRQNGSGGWLLTRYLHNGTTTENSNYLSDDITQLGNSHAPGPLCYRRFWRIDPEQGVIPFAACFTGFEEKNA